MLFSGSHLAKAISVRHPWPDLAKKKFHSWLYLFSDRGNHDWLAMIIADLQKVLQWFCLGRCWKRFGSVPSLRIFIVFTLDGVAKEQFFLLHWSRFCFTEILPQHGWSWGSPGYFQRRLTFFVNVHVRCSHLIAKFIYIYFNTVQVCHEATPPASSLSLWILRQLGFPRMDNGSDHS